MLITFKSKASGDVIMFGDVAKKLLEVMGKEPEDKGIITVEQLPEALSRLRKAAEDDRAVQRATQARGGATGGEDAQAGHGAVSLSQRAVPLIELLEWSVRKAVPVTWGV
jgi:hypothetical protein